MKQTLSAAFLILALASCKKEELEPQGNKVEYGIQCESCTFTFTTANDPKYTKQVTGHFLRAERNTLQQINLTTTGKGVIHVFVKVNDVLVFSQTETDQNGTEDYVIYDISDLMKQND